MVPAAYKNLINPWQSESEIRAQTKFLDRMFFTIKLAPEDFIKMALLDKPDWDWSKPK